MQGTLLPNMVLSGCLPEEIAAAFQEVKPFRALQIFQWIARGALSFDEMTNLSLQDRKLFQQRAAVYNSACAVTLTDPDGTIKLGLALHDNSTIETVLLADQNGRKTACVSCQVGCPMGCTFCQTGRMGYARNLAPNEIVEQFLHLEKICGKLDSIVFMGMGEPLLNLDSITKAVAILTHPKGRGLSHRRITLSTCGLCDGMYKLADGDLDIRLAVSLTVADEKLRELLMPVTKAHPLLELKKAIRYFNTKKRKRVTLELALLKGINTTREAARQLADFARGLEVHINLIPWNPVEGLPYERPADMEVRALHNALMQYGLNVTVRQKRGQTIGGACGQLGRKGIA